MSTAAKTPNYNLSQVAGSDIPDWITDYTSDMSKIDAALKENADDIATVRPDEFSEESTYAAGDYCIKDNVIYKAKTAVEAGAFDISDWTATTIFDELSGLNQKMLRYWTLLRTNVTEVYTIYPLNVGMKLSDYKYIGFTVVDNTLFRSPSILPSEQFITTKNGIEISYNSVNSERWIAIRYVSDTELSIRGKSNNEQTVFVYGVDFS